MSRQAKYPKYGTSEYYAKISAIGVKAKNPKKGFGSKPIYNSHGRPKSKKLINQHA